MAVYKVEAPDGKILEIEAPEGASQDDILSFASQSYTPKAQEEQSALRQVADVPLQLGKGAVTGVRLIADSFGADNPASKALRGAEDYIGELLSAQSKKDSAEVGRIMDEAKDKGAYDSVVAALKALSIAPVDFVANALGTAAPMLIGGITGLGLRGAAVIGGAMGAGTTKSSIYEAVRDELTKAGLSKEEAEARAQLAQQYNGENLDQILLGTGLGVISGFTGLEKALIPSAVRGIGQRVASKSALARAGAVAIGEAAPEALQGGQEQLAQNIALQREGFDTPTMRGVVGAGALEGLVGGVLGGGVGALHRGPTQQAQPALPSTQPTAPEAIPEVQPPALPAPPAPPTLTGQQVLEQQRIQKQQAAANQFSNEDNRFNVGSPTGFVSPPLMGPPSTRESLEQQRIQKQEAVPNNFDLKIPVPKLATMAPVTPAQTQPRPPATPNTAQKALRIDQLTRQLDTATTDFDRNLIQQQITEASGGAREASPSNFVDLTPMNLQTATARIGILQNQIAQDGGNALGLNVVPHPSTPNAFAIENRPVGLDLNLPQEPDVAQAEASSRLEQAASEAPPVRDAEQQARQEVLTGIMGAIAERGGVASPFEARMLADNGMGAPFDRIDQGLARQGSIDERLTEATGIALERGPRETVVDPEVVAEGRFQKMLQESNSSPAAPAVGAVLDALSTPTFARSADQVNTVRMAQGRLNPSNMGFLEEVASTTGPLDESSRTRLNNLIDYGPRFDLRDEMSPEAQALADDVKKQLLPMLKRFGLGKIGLSFVETLNDGKANGMYWKKVITLALDSDDPVGVMRHEVIHALKELGAFTDGEWKTLTKRARDEWIDKYLGAEILVRYRDQYLSDNNNDIQGFQEYIEEEAIAEAFKAFKQTKPPSGMIQSIMNRLAKFFDGIKEFFGSRDMKLENIFLTEDIFGSVESGRISAGRNVGRGNMAPAYSLRDLPPTVAQAAQEVGLTEEELAATSLPLQTGKPGKDGFKTPKVKGLAGAIEFLENRRLDSGLPQLDVMNDEDHDTIAKLITAEAMSAIRTGGNALDWYDGVIKKTLAMASLKHPELATDQNAGTAYRLAMAITSQNLDVEANIKLADRVYESFKNTGKFPIIGSGKSLAVMKKSFGRANKMIEAMGFDVFKTFLETPFTVRELQQKMKVKLSGESMDTMVLGSSVFGPKIGFGFYSNLNGNFDPVTMDMWFMRTIGRLTGKLKLFSQKKVNNQVARLREALKERGKNGIYANQFDQDLVKSAKTNSDSAFELAKLVKRAHEKDYNAKKAQYKDKTRVKSELVLSSETILNSLTKPIDTPASGGQRQKLRAIFSKVRDNVKRLYGSDVPSASLQAVIWYPEQTLYDTLGVKLRVTNQNYAGAMEKILLGEGYDSADIRTAAERGSRGVRQGDLSPDTRGVRSVDSGANRVSKREGVNGEPRYSIRPEQSTVRPSLGRDGGIDDGNGRGRYQSRSDSPLEGAPIVQGATGPDLNLVAVAEEYAGKNGIPFSRQSEYVDVDPVFSRRIAQAYENMQEQPQDLTVRNSYADMIRQVRDQYDTLVENGYSFSFFDLNTDPYGGNPFNAMRDLRQNKTMAVFGTYAGYGEVGITPEVLKNQPMLAETDLVWPDQNGVNHNVTANDLFRAVHDAFGHGLEGAGFRARGEENAFQAHVKLFTGPAIGALATETRGQNSWLNYGPSGEANQTARIEDTVFAPQKVGLMPSWTWTENVVDSQSAPRFSLRSDQTAFRPIDSGREGVSFQPTQPDAQSFTGSHYSKTRLNRLSKDKFGTGIRGAESKRLAQATDERIKKRVYFYVPKVDGTMPSKESGLGGFVHSQKLNNILASGQTMSRLSKEANGDANAFESLVIDAGYDGYAPSNTGMMVVLNQDVPVDYEGTVAELSKPKFSLRELSNQDRNELNATFYGKMLVNRYDEAVAAFNDLPTDIKNKIDSANISSRKASVTANDPGYHDRGERSAATKAFKQANQALVNHFGRELTPNEMTLYLSDVQGSINEELEKPLDTNRTRYSLRAPNTPEFKKFFKDSKVVDEQGNPLVVYHGTTENFDSFSLNNKKNRTGNPDGYYFTTDSNEASSYSEDGGGSNVIPAYLSIQKPFLKGSPVSKAMVDKFTAELRAENSNLNDSWIQGKVNIFKDNADSGRNYAPGLFPNISFSTDAMTRVMKAGDYDGFVDGRHWVAFDNNQIKSPFNETPDTQSPKFNLRPEQKTVTTTAPFKKWFGNSKVVNEDGSPKVMYHGTARDITEFAPKQANAIFVTASPRFAESFGTSSEDYMVKELFYQMPQVEKRNAIIKAAEALLKQNETTKSVVKNLQATEFEVPDKLVDAGWVLTDIGRSYDPVFSENLEIALSKILLEKLPSRENILPLYVRAEAPFDFENPEHILAIEPLAKYEKESDKQNDLFYVKQGSWDFIEGEIIQAAIKEAGFDSFYVLEGGTKNLAVYNPNQLKSATGNIGTFSESNDIRYNLVATAPNQPPKVLTKTTPVSRSGKVIVDETLDTLKDIVSNESLTNARIQYVDRYSGLTNALKDLPLYDPNSTLRADMIKHAQSQSVNLIKNGIVSGTPFLATDGTIAIERSENNIARSEILADQLNTNKNVVDSGMSGKNYVAEIARALVGEDILNEDKRLNALGRSQLDTAKLLYKEAKAIAKQGDFKESRRLLREIAKLRKEGYKNKNLKREIQVDAAQIAWAKKQLKDTPQVQEILDIWRNVSDSLVNLWKDVGLLSEEKAQTYLDRSFYVPLFKAREDLNDEKFFGLAGVGAKSPAKLKQLKGSEAIRNIWENLDKQYASMIANAYENQSRRIATQQMVGLGAATITNPSDPRVNLRYKEDGELVHAIVDEPTTLVAFQSFSYQLNPIMKFMGAVTNVLRAGALINPMFWLRQLIRDPLHATLVANSGIITPFHAAGNFIKVIADASPEARILTDRGVIGSIDSTVNLQDFLKDVGRDRLNKPNFMQQALHKLLQIHEASDAATRVAIFKRVKEKALKDGMSEEQAVDFAVFKARESINFGVSGMSPILNGLRQMIPFLNATIVGLDTLYKAATGYGLNAVERTEAMRQFRIKAGVMVAFATAYAIAYQNDDDYKKLPDFVKDNNFLIPIGTGEGKTFIKLAIPYEVGFIFKTVPEVAIRYLSGTSTGKEMLASYWGGLIHNIPAGGVPIPQAVRPALEVITNYSFFTGRPIEGMSDQGLPTAYRGDKASAFAKALSGAGLDKLSLSPAQIDYLFQGYFAELGTMTSELASYAVNSLNGATPPTRNLEELPFFKAFLTNPNSDKAVSNFYEISNTALETTRAFNNLVKRGQGEAAQELISDPRKRMMVGASSTMRQIRDKMSEVKAQMIMVREAQSMSPDERRDTMNRLQKVFNQLSQQGVAIADSLDLR